MHYGACTLRWAGISGEGFGGKVRAGWRPSTLKQPLIRRLMQYLFPWARMGVPDLCARNRKTQAELKAFLDEAIAPFLYFELL